MVIALVSCFKRTQRVRIEFQHVDRVGLALQRLATEEYDLVLLDLGLPDSQGLATFDLVHTRAPNQAIVVMTGYDDETAALEALDRGAQDYLFKTEINYQLLERSIRYAVHRHRVLRELRQAETAVQKLSAELLHVGRVSLLGELSAALAHELKQPLAAIQSNAQAGLEMLGPGVVDVNEIRDILTDMVADVQQASEVIHRLRRLMQKGQVEMQALNLNELVQEVLPLVRNNAQANEIVMRPDLDPALPPARGDRVQLAQVILNLVLNALDAVVAVPSRPREIVLHTARTAAGGVSLTVRDSGPGIPPAELDRVFDSFFTTKPTGMGMGLSICRSIVQAHGGRIWAANNLDRGATLQFDLPGTPAASP